MKSSRDRLDSTIVLQYSNNFRRRSYYLVKACTINSYELRYFLSFFLFFFFLKYNANIPLLSVQIMEDVRSEYKCFSAREVRATLLLVSFAKVQPRIY